MNLRLFRSTNFQLTLITASAFSFCFFILGVIVYYDVAESMNKQLRDHISAEKSQLLIDYQQDGLRELEHDIRERVSSKNIGRLLYFLETPQGRLLFDDFEKLPPGDGWYEDQSAGYLMHIIALNNGYRFGVATRLDDINATKKAIQHAFMIAAFVLFVLSLITGAWISHIFLNKVDQISETAAHIGEVDLLRRLPYNGTDDELDKLAATINTMLDRIQKLVDNLKYVSARIAHDLRTPLGHIRQNLELIQTMTKADDNQQQQLVELSIDQINGLLATFSALLRIAEVESGTRKAGFTKVNLSELWFGLAETYQPVVQDAQQVLVVDIQDNIYISGDKCLLAQLFVNLVENTIQHAGKNANIFIQLKQQNQMLMLSFEDNGAGILPEAVDDIFKPFYRRDSARNSAGSGLGLSLVQAIAELHGLVFNLKNTVEGFSISFVKHF